MSCLDFVEGSWMALSKWFWCFLRPAFSGMQSIVEMKRAKTPQEGTEDGRPGSQGGSKCAIQSVCVLRRSFFFFWFLLKPPL